MAGSPGCAPTLTTDVTRFVCGVDADRRVRAHARHPDGVRGGRKERRAALADRDPCHPVRSRIDPKGGRARLRADPDRAERPGDAAQPAGELDPAHHFVPAGIDLVDDPDVARGPQGVGRIHDVPGRIAYRDVLSHAEAPRVDALDAVGAVAVQPERAGAVRDPTRAVADPHATGDAVRLGADAHELRERIARHPQRTERVDRRARCKRRVDDGAGAGRRLRGGRSSGEENDDGDHCKSAHRTTSAW
jgi:hypothetical protein